MNIICFETTHDHMHARANNALSHICISDMHPMDPSNGSEIAGADVALDAGLGTDLISASTRDIFIANIQT